MERGVRLRFATCMNTNGVIEFMGEEDEHIERQDEDEQ